MLDAEVALDAEIEQAAIRLLSYREHTAWELLQKLQKKGYRRSDIETVLQDLKQQKLLNDQRYAEQYIFQRSTKGYGPVRIRQELRDKGVSGEMIDDGLVAYEDAWSDIMGQSLHKKFGNTPVLNYSDRAKRARFLEYRGFPSALIRQRLFDEF